MSRLPKMEGAILRATISYILGLAARCLNSSSSVGVRGWPVLRPGPCVSTWIPSTRRYGWRIPMFTFSLDFWSKNKTNLFEGCVQFNTGHGKRARSKKTLTLRKFKYVKSLQLVLKYARFPFLDPSCHFSRPKLTADPHPKGKSLVYTFIQAVNSPPKLCKCRENLIVYLILVFFTIIPPLYLCTQVKKRIIQVSQYWTSVLTFSQSKVLYSICYCQLTLDGLAVFLMA